MSKTPSIPDVARVPVTFQVRGHVLRLTRASTDRWTTAVDGAPLEGSYRTEAEAWEAGVREADRLDASAGTAP